MAAAVTPADLRAKLLAPIRSGEFRLRREGATEMRGVRAEITMDDPPRLKYPTLATFGTLRGLLWYLAVDDKTDEMLAGWDSTFRDSHEGRSEWWLLGFEMRAYADVGAT